MKLIVVLGNPGNEYAQTRHNVGFLFGDFYKENIPFSLKKKTSELITYSAHILNQEILLLYPLTYMNLSGIAVRKIASLYKIQVENILIIYDDFEFNLGTFKLKPKGSGGTHNGMKSVIQELGSTLMPRLRIGIGPMTEKEITRYVLSVFPDQELNHLKEFVFIKLKSLINLWIEFGTQLAISKQKTNF